jgi:VanZ family protein
MRGLMLAGGWLYAAAIALLSLLPRAPQIGIEHGDKLGHFAAYSLLMFWFCQLYRARNARIAYAAGWIAMGVALEFAQEATGYRSFELADIAANSLGVLLGWGISATLRR